MSVDEFMHWQAFYQIDPWGGYRQDLQSANICSVFANVNRGKDTKAFELGDFLMFQQNPKPDEDEIDQDVLNAGILAIFGNMKPQIKEQLEHVNSISQ